jgi:hypothetical protein
MARVRPTRPNSVGQAQSGKDDNLKWKGLHFE